MEITYYSFLELPYFRQKIEYNKIRKSKDLNKSWKQELFKVCNSKNIDNLNLLSLTSFCKRYIKEVKDNDMKIIIDFGMNDTVTFLTKNNIPERYANLFSELSFTQLKAMSLVELILINGIGNSTAKKIHKLIK